MGNKQRSKPAQLQHHRVLTLVSFASAPVTEPGMLEVVVGAMVTIIGLSWRIDDLLEIGTLCYLPFAQKCVNFVGNYKQLHCLITDFPHLKTDTLLIQIPMFVFFTLHVLDTWSSTRAYQEWGLREGFKSWSHNPHGEVCALSMEPQVELSHPVCAPCDCDRESSAPGRGTWEHHHTEIHTQPVS